MEALFAEHGYTDLKWINPQEIVVAQWVRMKCMSGCSNYGRNASCPPNVPAVPECRRYFDEYNTAVILHFEKVVDRPEDRHPWSKGVNEGLLKLERAVFLPILPSPNRSSAGRVGNLPILPSPNRSSAGRVGKRRGRLCRAG